MLRTASFPIIKLSIPKQVLFNTILSLLLLTVATYSHAAKLTLDPTITTLLNLNSCYAQTVIASLEGQDSTNITSENCNSNSLDLKFETPRLPLSVPLPELPTSSPEGSSKIIKALNISNFEKTEQAPSQKRSGILKFSTWWLFVTIAFMNMASPGGATLLSVTTSITWGFSRAFFTTIGHAIAMIVAAATAVFGLGYIIESASYVLIGFKLLAALYFIYLGINQWKSKVNIFETLTSSKKLDVSNLSLLINGFFIGILNPHTFIFFTAFTPKVLDTTNSLTLQFIVIAATYIFISISVLTGYAGAAVSVKRWFSLPRRVLWFKRISGAMFVVLGIGILRLKDGVL